MIDIDKDRDEIHKRTTYQFGTIVVWLFPIVIVTSLLAVAWFSFTHPNGLH